MESSRREIGSVQEGLQRVSQNLTLRSSFIKKITKEMRVRVEQER